jgi:carbonic anhydrase/acetyltransferase-like protein (isoleucine patch superfamily)
MISRNPGGEHPQIHDSAYVDPTAVIIGKVKIGRKVFVGPGAVIRADEPGSSITVEDNCNIQDRVVIHALGRSSVLIAGNTSLAHGCIVHGPCSIGPNCFIGFGSVVFNADIGSGVCIKHLAVVEDVQVMPGKVIGSGSLVSREGDVRELRQAGETEKQFMENVIEANLELVEGYKNG